jgi:hypothetical protein
MSRQFAHLGWQVEDDPVDARVMNTVGFILIHSIFATHVRHIRALSAG